MNEPGHLSDQTLNEYLDGVLSSRALAQAEGHLKECELCSRRLAEVTELFATLDGLPEVPLDRDLAPGVVDSIRARAASHRRSSLRSTWRLGLALTAEAVGALVLLGLVWPEALSGLSRGATLDLTGPVISLVEEVGVFLSAVLTSPDPLGLEAFAARISAPSIPWASLSSLIILLTASVFVWLLGNGLLIRRGPLAANRRDR